MHIFHSSRNALVVLAVALQRSHAFTPALFVRRQQSSHLNAVTPVGPFCPFRSSSSIELEPKMEAINAAGPEFAKEMTKIQLDMSIGEMPDPERLNRVADGLEQAVDQWENLVARLRLSSDFQTREYAKLTQAHLQSHGMTVDGIASMIRWQAGCMRAMANNTPPPMPPAHMNLEQLMNDNQQREKPSITAMAAAEAITATPFSKNSPAFDAPNVKQEHDTLCRDHSNLIEFGAKYDSFDPLGKLYYLDEIEKIEDRWDVFFTRFKLMGQLDAAYLQQCDRFLASMGMTEEEYRKLLKQSHALMREEAEAERNLYVA
ncbi:hypothetical protein FisN_13Lh100 [Fistulifera solaris]|uniref:Uncharacterized protein n=1 Tax=Fistulifera solaris TaxID=1519565 RepID=A0A1Z5JFF8_FISSO|nr:hypothetical protein FisN_13Lh100 [Fistulifera solaris]|eukprot:GAX12632.1 hypothetical protein FisN_13Lh100 [Fistulifera solaris]